LSASSERPSATGTRERVKASRRSWPPEEKRRIVEEAFRPGTSVADVARRHGLNSNQVFNWRRLYGTQPAAQGSGSLVHADASSAGAPDGFLSIGVIAEPKNENAVVPRPDPSALLMGHAREDGGVAARPAMDERPGMIEIDLPCGTRLRVDALVNERALRRVLSMLRTLS
jgi:transposase